MARPTKTGLDYFPLDVKFDSKIQALEHLHKNDGLVWIIKFWQLAYSTNDGVVDLSDIYGIIHSENCRITIGKHLDIISDCIKLQLLHEVEPNKYTSNGIKKRIEKISSDRENDRKRKGKGFSDGKPPESDGKPPENGGNRKGKRKGNICIPPQLSEVISFFLENGYSEAGATEAYQYYTDGDWTDRNGDKVKNWKQKMRVNWFQDKYKKQTGPARVWKPQ